MSAAAITYGDFTERGFTASEGDFKAALPAAQAIVDRIVGPNAVDTDEKVEAYTMAVCAAAASVAENGIAPHANMSLGSFTIGAEGGETGGRQQAEAAACVYLVVAGLMYAGV